jgi:hypothetical protein
VFYLQFLTQEWRLLLRKHRSFGNFLDSRKDLFVVSHTSDLLDGQQRSISRNALSSLVVRLEDEMDAHTKQVCVHE